MLAAEWAEYDWFWVRAEEDDGCPGHGYQPAVPCVCDIGDMKVYDDMGSDIGSLGGVKVGAGIRKLLSRRLQSDTAAL